ncbi:MAG: amidohydrolase family protein [Victivallales bacterium]|jgi:predicted TIM-barrel fold metal-dependent hydrolase|nr:amidohydrolase family protein [Victivallales bacterium]
MKIIDTHIHYSRHEGFAETAKESGQVNTADAVAKNFTANGVIMAIAMGTGRSDENSEICEPMRPDLGGEVTLQNYGIDSHIAYCAGVDSGAITPQNTSKSLEMFERFLQTPQCVGLKFYPGYHHLYLSDKRHYPFFELAAAYDVPVVIHSGDTAGNRGQVKYSHPLTIDEVAVDFPQTRFVLAHYGNPWIVDATEVAAKNENVSIDLSGLAAGVIDHAVFLEQFRGYIEHLKTWMAYLGNWEKFMYGSDYPLVNIGEYIKVIQAIVPEQHHEKVFYANALQIFSKLRAYQLIMEML